MYSKTFAPIHKLVLVCSVVNKVKFQFRKQFVDNIYSGVARLNRKMKSVLGYLC